jgi:hypothetical protein
MLNVEEFLRSTSSLDEIAEESHQGTADTRTHFSSLLFRELFDAMQGLTTLNGKPAWQIYFARERINKLIRAYRIGERGPSIRSH